MKKKIKVLVVDDSAVDRMLLVHIINTDPRLEVVGTANNGAGAVELNERLNPDVIVMDVTMPGMDGLETTSRIMHTKPVPIVICTSLYSADPTISFRAVEAGALTLIEKPEGLEHADYYPLARSLAENVALMSEVKLVRRRSNGNHGARLDLTKPRFIAPKLVTRPNLIAIGTSTGGPPAIRTILAGLPPGFPVPILIVQHIAAGFLSGMVSWLQDTTGVPVHVAQHNEVPLLGHAYLAPDGCHMGVNALGAIALSRHAPMNGLRPAVAHLFLSIASTPFAANVVGVLLTGMGSDGAAELKALKDLGAITIAQDAESSAVHGMPGAAIQLGGATHILSLEKIAQMLSQYADNQTPRLDVSIP